MERCPDIVRQRAAILSERGFGFPLIDETSDYFLVAYLDKEIKVKTLQEITRLDNEIKIEINASEVVLLVHWKAHSRIDKILSKNLENRFFFQLANNYNLKFDPKNNKDDRKYNKEMVEWKFVDKELNFLKNLDKVYFKTPEEIPLVITNYLNYRGRYFAMTHDFNYETRFGKLFCKNLREDLQKSQFCTNLQHNYPSQEIFRNCNFKTLLDY